MSEQCSGDTCTAMLTDGISRRRFLVTSVGLTAINLKASQSLTAGQVIDRIKANVGIPWRAQTVDNIIFGTADAPVKGIATTMMATLDVVQRAAASGRNMIITHEPTFYSHQDTTDQLLQDPTYKFKTEFMTKNGMVVVPFSRSLAWPPSGRNSNRHDSRTGLGEESGSAGFP